MQRRYLVIFVMVVMGLLLISCGGSKDQDAIQQSVPSEISDMSQEPSYEEGEKTGQEVQDPSEMKEDDSVAEPREVVFTLPEKGVRPYAVMIDNAGSGCLPQGGLEQAQVIYEIIVEGGLTRLMALFWGVEPEMVGPVRSARHYFIDYALEHDAIYVHFGWSPQAQKDIQNLKINNINGVLNSGGIFYDLTTKSYQDSYTTGSKILDYSRKSKYAMESKKDLVFQYEPQFTVPETETTAQTVKIKYSQGYNCGFSYDEHRQTYLRYRMGDAQVERINGNQLTAKNILIQITSNWTIQGDREGRQEVVTVGSGKGWFITGGKALEIQWSKASRNAPTLYKDASGKSIILNPGPTWVQIVPKNAKITIE